ncbi:MAG TPA: hypothetical protein PKC79_21495 [Solidesulfovibrio magneticus]|nr:hypothetical protein [Solidesulfovibrio magneticus]
MTDDLTPYIERSAATDLPTLLRAKEELKKRMRDDPSKPTVEAFRAVRDEVDKAVADRPAGEGRLFAKRPAALAYLQGRGFKVQKTKFNDDCKAGMVPTNAQGQFEEAVLLAYAAKLPVAAKEEDGQLAAESRRRLAADADHKSEQALLAKMRREKLEGRLVPRVEVERGLAARAQFFRAQIENFGPLVGSKLIEVVGGDEAKLPAFLELWEEMTADWMDAWSADREFVAGPGAEAGGGEDAA